MDIASILALGREFLVLILVFVALFAYSIVRGKRGLMSIILGLYIALLISLEFPYYEKVLAFASGGGNREAIAMIITFAVFTVIGSLLFERLLSYEYEERAFEGIWKKTVLAVLGTILVMTFSYHVLPITSLVDPGSTIGSIFGPQEYFFWFLIIPLIGMFIV